MIFTKDDYKKLMDYLDEHKDEKYREFHQRLLKNDNIKLIGIRIPLLKQIAKDISKKDYLGFIKLNTHKTYEEDILHGLVLGYIKVSQEELFKLIDEFLIYNNNWATNDITCANLKAFKKIKIGEIDKYLNSPNPWIIRFGLVLLLDHYITDENIDKILEICDNVKSTEYYVQMANAWLISICFIKFQDQTYKYLLNNNLDTFTFNKSISKICDSFRVDKNVKEELKQLRR